MSGAATWHDVYVSDLQSLWALIAVPFAFLVYQLATGTTRAGRREDVFVAFYCLGWTLETLLDPIVGGPISRALGWADGFAGTVVMFLFVLLGDLRVFVLVFGLPSEDLRYLRRAAGFTLIVPIATGVLYGSATLLADPHPQVMWLIYELGFLAMALWLLRRWVPADVSPENAEVSGMLRAALGFVAVYYALWASCDLLILAGVDEGWALRMLPNQLYYALWVPFVYVRWFATKSATSSSDHASR